MQHNYVYKLYHTSWVTWRAFWSQWRMMMSHWSWPREIWSMNFHHVIRNLNWSTFRKCAIRTFWNFHFLNILVVRFPGSIFTFVSNGFTDGTFTNVVRLLSNSITSCLSFASSVFIQKRQNCIKVKRKFSNKSLNDIIKSTKLECFQKDSRSKWRFS